MSKLRRFLLSSVIIILARALPAAAEPAVVPAADDGGFFDTYGTQVDDAQFRELSQWARGLPAVGKAFQSYILCSVRPHGSPAIFDHDFEACWSGADPTRSCAYRCGGETHVFGFYAPSPIGPGAIQHVIVCHCDNLRHDCERFPVPAIMNPDCT